VYVIQLLDDINGLDDPASIGWTIISIGLLFIMYSAFFCMMTEINDSSTKQRLLNFIKKQKQLVKVLSALCLCVIGMLVMKLSIALHNLLAANELYSSEAVLGLLLIALTLILLWLEARFRHKWHNGFLQALRMNNGAAHTIANKLETSEQGYSLIKNDLEDLQEKIAREVMTPRIDMICLEQHLSFKENINIAINHMRTRYPVVNEDKDDIIGFMHIKDLLAMYEANDSRAQWQKWIRPIITVPESIEISQLLSMMQNQKTQIALLIDEYGGTSGMVTMEDIIEEIVGDIQDEFDQEELRIIRLKHDDYRLSAMLLIEEVNSFFNIHLEADDMDSIGGFMYANIQFPPHLGQSVIYEQEGHRYIFSIIGMEQLRITSVGVKRCNNELRKSSPQL